MSQAPHVVLLLAACAGPPSTTPGASSPQPTADTAEPLDLVDSYERPPVDTTSDAYLGDCDPLDPNVGPDAVDVDGDGIDSDCDGQDGPSVRPALVFRGPGPDRNLTPHVGGDADGEGLPDVVSSNGDALWFWSPLSGATRFVGLSSGCTQRLSANGSAEAGTLAYERCPAGTMRSWRGGRARAFDDVGGDAWYPYVPAMGRLDPGQAFGVEKPNSSLDGDEARLVRWDLRRGRAEWLAAFPQAGRVLAASPVVADLAGDGHDELLFHLEGQLHHCAGIAAGPVACAAHDPGGLEVLGDVPPHDLDGDGRHEVALRGPDGVRLAYAVADHLDDLGAAPAATVAGGSVLPMPDLTGDGVPDVLVAFFGADLPGRIHLVAGPVAPGVVAWEGSPSWAGRALGGNFGVPAIPADVDGDGLLDLVVGARNDGYGAVWVIPGSELQRP